MSDDEDDYMSDKFLTAETTRPSLINDRAKKRKVEISEQQKRIIKKQREERLERTGANRNERLQASLQKPIEAANKGFQMLAKMGYKPGQALGKETNATATTSKPLTEPIGISIKADRGGLGREAALRELAEKRQQLREQRMRKTIDECLTAEEYRRRATQKAEERFVHGALRRCQLSCENLDMAADLKTPEMSWFWPERIIEASESETETNAEEATDATANGTFDDEEYTNAEKLEMLTMYLRTSYKFCFWCGVRYQDADDLNSNCPGLTRDEH